MENYNFCAALRSFPFYVPLIHTSHITSPHSIFHISSKSHMRDITTWSLCHKGVSDLDSTGYERVNYANENCTTRITKFQCKS